MKIIVLGIVSEITDKVLGHICFIPNVVLEWLTFVFPNQEVTG
jgi:hypothetical protein